MALHCFYSLVRKVLPSSEVSILFLSTRTYFVSSKYVALIRNFNVLHQIFCTHMDSFRISILGGVCVLCTKSSTRFVVRSDMPHFSIIQRWHIVPPLRKHLEEEDEKDYLLRSLSWKRRKVNPCWTEIGEQRVMIPRHGIIGLFHHFYSSLVF